MIALLGDAAIAIGGSLALSLIVKATIASGAALIAVRLAKRAAASVRHLLLASSFAVLLVLPVAALTVPALEVGVPITPPVRTMPTAPPRTMDVAPPVVASVDETPLPQVVSTRGSLSVGTILLLVWISGVAIVLTRLVADMRWVRRIRLQARTWPRGEAAVAGIPGQSSRRNVTRVLLDETAAGPMTCGVLRPVIVLPGEARHWAPDALERAVIHELEHVRRGDLLMFGLARIVCGLYWFHPLVWSSWRQLRLEAERACDDAVLRGVAPVDYADQLVTLAERLVSRRIESVPAMADRTDLARRITALLDPQQRRGRAGFRMVTFVSLVSLLFVAAASSLRAVPQSQSPDLAAEAQLEAATLVPPVLNDAGPIAPDPAQAPAPVATIAPAAVALPWLPPGTTGAAGAPPIPAEQKPPTPAAPAVLPPSDDVRVAGVTIQAAQAQNANSAVRGPYNSPSTATLGDKKFTRSGSAVDPALERRLEEALKAGDGSDRLFLSADASYRQLNSAEYQVPVTVRIAPPLVTGRGDLLRLEVVGVIQDAPYSITQVRIVDAFELALDANARDALATTPIVYQGTFVLLPGRYRIRVLVRDPATDRIGVIDVPFFVPNLNRIKPPQ